MRIARIIIWAFFLAAISFFIYQDLRGETIYFYGFEDESKIFRKFTDQDLNNFEVIRDAAGNAFLKTKREISTFDFFFIDSPAEEFLDIEARFRRSDQGDFLIAAKKSDFWADYGKYSLLDSNGEFIVGRAENLRLTDFYLDFDNALDFWLIAPEIEKSGGEILIDYIKITVKRDGFTTESIAKSLPRSLYNFLKNNFYGSKNQSNHEK